VRPRRSEQRDVRRLVLAPGERLEVLPALRAGRRLGQRQEALLEPLIFDPGLIGQRRRLNEVLVQVLQPAAQLVQAWGHRPELGLGQGAERDGNHARTRDVVEDPIVERHGPGHELRDRREVSERLRAEERLDGRRGAQLVRRVDPGVERGLGPRDRGVGRPHPPRRVDVVDRRPPDRPLEARVLAEEAVRPKMEPDETLDPGVVRKVGILQVELVPEAVRVVRAGRFGRHEQDGRE
jgi:hypothetical protein